MCNDGRQVHAVSIEIINDKYVYNAIHTHTMPVACRERHGGGQ